MDAFLSGFWIIIGILAAGVACIAALRLIISIRGKRIDRQKQRVLLQILPVRTNETSGPLSAEQIFATLHSALPKVSDFKRFFGVRSDRFSFEMAHIDQQVKFFVSVPEEVAATVESQFSAQYPGIEIMRVPDYARANLSHLSSPICIDLKLKKGYVYPIKRYGYFENKLAKLLVDPMGGLTGGLSRLSDPEEQVWVQIVAAPVGDFWQKRGKKYLKIIEKMGFSERMEKFFTKVFLSRGIRRIKALPWLFMFWIMRGGSAGAALEEEGGKQDDRVRALDKESPQQAALDKLARMGYDCEIRIAYLPKPHHRQIAQQKLKEIASSFHQFAVPTLNEFVATKATEQPKALFRSFLYREFADPFILSVEELATIYHMPLFSVTTPNIEWVSFKRLETPLNIPTAENSPKEDFTALGVGNSLGKKVEFGLRTEDRRRHIYIIGKTGMGKSTLLENMLFSDIEAGKGVAVIDPHGDLAEKVIDFVPKRRKNDLVIFDPSDADFPVSFNMLECKNPEHRTLAASGLLGIFKKMYAESWGPRLEHILRNTLLALMEYPGSTMLGIMRILVDEEYRDQVVRKVTDPMVKSFWLDEFGKWNDKQRIEAISPIQNKVGQFLSSPIIRNIVGQPKSSVDVRFAMDKGKIFVVNLSKGKIGEDNSSLLGSMMITKFQLDAMSRADIPEKERRDFMLYVDEFQNFATDSFGTILSEARKYRLSLTMANQYIGQMEEPVRDAVFGNVGSMITFQVGFDDAEHFESQFSEEVTTADITGLPKYHAYMRLLVNGMPTKVFSAATLPPPEVVATPDERETMIRMCRERYAKPRSFVEGKILEWAQAGKTEEAPRREKLQKKG